MSKKIRGSFPLISSNFLKGVDFYTFKYAQETAIICAYHFLMHNKSIFLT